MSDKYLKVKDNGAAGLALVRAEAEDVAEDLGVTDLKEQLKQSESKIFGTTDTFPLEFENGTYNQVSVGSTLEKYYGMGYDKTRKVVKTTVFNAPCNVTLTAKSGYGFTVYDANDGVITKTSGVVTSYTLTGGKQYGITLRTTNGTGDISALSADQIVEIWYESNIDVLESNVKELKTQIDILQDAFEMTDYEEMAINGYDSRNTTNTLIYATPFVFYNAAYDFVNAKISKIKLNVSQIGTISIGVIKKSDIVLGSPIDRSKLLTYDVINTGETGLQEIEVNNPFYVKDDEYLFMGNNTDSCIWLYGSYGNEKGFYYTSSNIVRESTASVGIDIYTTSLADPSIDNFLDNTLTQAGKAADAKATGDAIRNANSEIEEIKSGLGYSIDTLLAVNGFNDGNNRSTIPANAPFIYYDENFDYSDTIITKIKLNVSTAGILSIGTIKKSNVVQGAGFDRATLSIKNIITISETGTQEITIENPFTIENDEFLFIGNNTDTCIWKYGEYGNDKNFYYVSNNTIAFSPNSVGVDIEVTKQTGITIRPLIESIYKGKSISILGDSISTFDGYIPTENATYYPTGNVLEVTDTWWKKLIDALGMTLDVNNSWSGSRVTTTNGDASAGCGDRCEALGTSPDVIIVWMGINDFNGEVALGTYDGASAIPSTTTTFREAYGIMLNKILTKYQTAEVWVCTLPQCERNADTVFPEINGNGVAIIEFNKAIKELADAFGVKVLDHNKCGLTYQNMPTFNPDELHPNKFGHSLVANNDIRQMDNAISKRYPIS